MYFCTEVNFFYPTVVVHDCHTCFCDSQGSSRRRGPNQDQDPQEVFRGLKNSVVYNRDVETFSRGGWGKGKLGRELSIVNIGCESE